MTLQKKFTFGSFGLLGLAFVSTLTWGIITGRLTGQDDGNEEYNSGDNADIRVEIPDSIATLEQIKRIRAGEESDDILAVQDKIDKQVEETIINWAKDRYAQETATAPPQFKGEDKGPSFPQQSQPLQEEGPEVWEEDGGEAEDQTKPLNDLIITYTKNGEPIDLETIVEQAPAPSPSQPKEGTPGTPAPMQGALISPISNLISNLISRLTPKIQITQTGGDEGCGFKICLEFKNRGGKKNGQWDLKDPLNWKQSEKDAVFSLYKKSYPQIKNIYGEPIFEMSGQNYTQKLKIEKWKEIKIEGRFYPGAFYHQTTYTINLRPDIVAGIAQGGVEYQHTFIHETIHAFRGIFTLTRVTWEEGMAEAAARLVANEVIGYSGRDVEEQYDLWNVEYIETNRFRSDETIGENFRYSMSAAAFEKLYYATDGKFLKIYNDKIRAHVGDIGQGKWGLFITIGKLKGWAADALRAANGHEKIEGDNTFNEWYDRQYIFSQKWQEKNYFRGNSGSLNRADPQGLEFPCLVKKDRKLGKKLNPQSEIPVDAGEFHAATYIKGNLRDHLSVNLWDPEDPGLIESDDVVKDKNYNGCLGLHGGDRTLVIYRDRYGESLQTQYFRVQYLFAENNPYTKFYGPVTQAREGSKVVIESWPSGPSREETDASKGYYFGGAGLSPGQYSLTYLHQDTQSKRYGVSGLYASHLYIKNDFNEPLISNIQTTPNSSTSMKLTWKTTDSGTGQAESTSGVIEYGEAKYNKYAKIKFIDSLNSNQEVDLYNLKNGEKYIYRLTAIDKAGYQTQRTGEFTMLGPQIAIYDIRHFEETDHSVKIAWKTIDEHGNELKTTSKVIYRDNQENAQDREIASGSFAATHEIKIDNLRPWNSYSYKVTAEDKDKNWAQSVRDSFETKHLYVEFEISNITESSAKFTWRAYHSDKTPVSSTGSIYNTPRADYLKNKYANGVSYDFRDAAFEHSVVAQNLKQSTEYHVELGVDSYKGIEYGNVCGYVEKNYTTGIFGIRDIKDWQISETSQGVSWKTRRSGQPVESMGTVKYGLDKSNLSQSVQSAQYKAEHSVELTGLTTGKLYYYQIFAQTKTGGKAKSGIKPFYTRGGRWEYNVKDYDSGRQGKLVYDTGKDWIYLKGVWSNRPARIRVEVADTEIYNSQEYLYETPPLYAGSLKAFAAYAPYVFLEDESGNKGEFRITDDGHYELLTKPPSMTSVSPSSGTTLKCKHVGGYEILAFDASFSWDVPYYVDDKNYQRYPDILYQGGDQGHVQIVEKKVSPTSVTYEIRIACYPSERFHTWTFGLAPFEPNEDMSRTWYYKIISDTEDK